MSEFNQFAEELRIFFAARDWGQFHAPKNLAMSLVSESAELMQHFRWCSEEASRHLSPEVRQEVEDELGDVLINVVALATELNIDLLQAARKKLAEIGERFPTS